MDAQYPTTSGLRVRWHQAAAAFAGDRRMLHPELTESATKEQAADMAAMGTTAHASCHRTCELG